MLYIRPHNRWEAFVVNLVGNFAQVMVLLTMGVAGACFLLFKYHDFSLLYMWVVLGLVLAGLGTMFLIYFNIKVVIRLAGRFPWFCRVKRFIKDVQVLEHFNRKQLLDILKWSGIRYGIYTSQYFFLTKFFDIKTSVLEGYASIATIFFDSNQYSFTAACRFGSPGKSGSFRCGIKQAQTR